MAGNQTHGFDLAIQFSSHFFNQFLGTVLDGPVAGGSGNLLCQLMTALHHPELCGAFTIDVLMSRPTDISIPANATDFLDIHIGLASGAVTLRFVVGIIVDRSQPNADIFLLDFQNHLFAAEFKIAGLPIPGAGPIIASTLKQIPLPSIPLANGRASTSPSDMIRADTRVIDDTSPAGLDAWAILLTFGGGTPGSLPAFTQGFIPAGGNGAVAIYFHWLMRILSPMLASALGMDPSNIDDGHLVNPFTIDDDNDVTLSQLDMTLEDGFIKIVAKVTKSGFCYSASGTVSASLKLAIENGKLIVNPHVDDPDIDVDVPWYCWLGGIALGAIIGGVLFGVIGAIVGGVLVPLITWIATEVIEGVVESVTSLVSNAINNLLPDVNVAIPGIDFIFNDVFIDDILIKATATVKDTSPIKCSGAVLLHNGQYLDLDTGTVESDDTAGADIHLAGSGFARFIETVCRTTLARTNQKNLASLARFNCYSYPYQMNTRIPLSELAEFDIWGLITGDKYDEQRFVYAVTTNENRFSLFRVTEVTDTTMRIEFKTFGLAQSLALTGGFTCGDDWRLSESAAIAFTPAPILLQAQPALLSSTLTTAALARTLPTPATTDTKAAPAAAINIRNLGTFLGTYTTNKKDTGRFTAQAAGLANPITYRWAINNTPLDGPNGSVTIDGKKMNWSVDANHLSLTPIDHQSFTFELKVVAADNALTTLTKIKCIKYTPICRITKRTLPHFRLYQTHYQKLWGPAELPQTSLAHSESRT